MTSVKTLMASKQNGSSTYLPIYVICHLSFVIAMKNPRYQDNGDILFTSY